ncbi:DNA helicase [Microbacterium trichothecenolyticum]|uniref:DNA helicase n=1 Tax=Microbacterium trichothecenolyticum TaxID=69370 RepID=UPI001C6E959D|nr:DNA helicase [Microbacterium trichothecenolyticum]MBW9120191.1 DNA helicase [Microbacterium trichothecenolyticum]
MSLSRKRKKELHKLQKQAGNLWEAQQILVGEAAGIAREASRQLGNYGREQVKPQVQAGYDKYAAPYVDKGRNVVNRTVIPAAGAVVGSALSVWDAANEQRSNLASGRGFSLPSSWTKAAPVPAKKGIGAGGVIAIILGVAAAVGVLYAAWQTLRADDELWVADDPLRAPDA